jgi:hypothetical protein
MCWKNMIKPLETESVSLGYGVLSHLTGGKVDIPAPTRRPPHVVARFSQAREGFEARLESEYRFGELQGLPGDFRVLAWERPPRWEEPESSNLRVRQV